VLAKHGKAPFQESSTREPGDRPDTFAAARVGRCQATRACARVPASPLQPLYNRN